MNDKPWKIPRTLAAAAVAVGVAGGSYGIASAAPSTAAPWGRQRSDETLLTGDTASKVRDLALAKVPGGTIVRVETDADGHAAYEAHMVDADGNPVTVYVDTSFNVVSVESGGPGGGPGAPLTATGHTA